MYITIILKYNTYTKSKHYPGIFLLECTGCVQLCNMLSYDILILLKTFNQGISQI